jgi:nitroreductase
MNELINLIKNRRTCRNFSEKEVSESDVKQILECALSAPSGMNYQTWTFVAIMNREKIQKLAKAVGEALNRENYNMYNPSVLILTTNDKESRFREVDNACAMQNIYLSCEDLGLGCVWINQLKDCYDEPEVRAILDELGVPKNHGVYGSAAIGYKSQETLPKEIKGTFKIVK